MSHRPEQIAKEIQKAMSKVFQEELPMERYGLVTITDVVVSRGMEHATIYVSTLMHTRALIEELNHKVGKWKDLMIPHLILRKIPTITFEMDISNERVDRLNSLLDRDTLSS